MICLTNTKKDFYLPMFPALLPCIFVACCGTAVIFKYGIDRHPKWNHRISQRNLLTIDFCLCGLMTKWWQFWFEMQCGETTRWCNHIICPHCPGNTKIIFLSLVAVFFSKKNPKVDGKRREAWRLNIQISNYKRNMQIHLVTFHPILFTTIIQMEKLLMISIFFSKIYF